MKKGSSTDETVAMMHRRVAGLLPDSIWVLRFTDHKDKPSPVLVMKERIQPRQSFGEKSEDKPSYLQDRGLIYGPSLRRCLLPLRAMLALVIDPAGIPLHIEEVLIDRRFAFRGNLPLNDEAGAKIALLCKLQERVQDLDRVELMAWRIERFSREEALYWWTRVTQFGPEASLWAQAGMRVMLGGQPGDPAIGTMLTSLRK